MELAAVLLLLSVLSDTGMTKIGLYRFINELKAQGTAVKAAKVLSMDLVVLI